MWIRDSKGITEMKLFLVEGTLFRTYFGEDQERIEDTRLVMAVNEVDAGAKYENWWIAKTDLYNVSYYAIASEIKQVIE